MGNYFFTFRTRKQGTETADCSLKYPVLPQRVPIRRRKEKANEEVKNARRYTGSSFLSSEPLSVEEEELSDSDYKKPQT